MRFCPTLFSSNRPAQLLSQVATLRLSTAGKNTLKTSEQAQVVKLCELRKKKKKKFTKTNNEQCLLSSRWGHRKKEAGKKFEKKILSF